MELSLPGRIGKMGEYIYPPLLCSFEEIKKKKISHPIMTCQGHLSL